MITLHVDLGEEWRGGQHQALQLMRGLRSRGHVAELVALRDSPLARRAQAEGIAVHEAGRLAPQLLAALPLKKLAGQARFEVVHIHDAHGLTPAWLAGVHKRARLIASRRVIYPIPQNPLALARYRAVHRVVAVSRFVKETLLTSGLARDQVEVIYDGVEVPPVPGLEERLEARRRWNVPDSSDGPLLGYAGYFLAEKGQESLIRALPMVQERYPHCRLLLPGDGPCRTRLEQLARHLGVQSAVVFPGFVDDIEQVYRALDVYIFPSRAEGLGSSLLSAMSYGLPVVAVAQCAVPEVIQDGRNGLLVPSPDTEAIAAAILRLLDDSSLSASLGAAARATIQQRFSADRLVQDTLGLYERLCAGPESAR
ncbi:MAG TPA: glycosyltransferase family 4 protein [Terriglobia bacterium]|nr:glycosyltransferase family 4 protein [Terriglobia bacterium]